MDKKIEKKYIPMTETAYYLLLALGEERHGYGAMLHIEELTAGRLKIGAGTIYGTLSKMEKDGLIITINEDDRRKTYKQTETGRKLLELEISRLEELLKNGQIEKEKYDGNKKNI